MQSKGILHRDLKLGNVFMGNNMQLKIGDFGLATHLKKEREEKAFVVHQTTWHQKLF